MKHLSIASFALTLVTFDLLADVSYPLYEIDCPSGTRESPMRLDDLEVWVSDSKGAGVRTVPFRTIRLTDGTFMKRGRGWLMSSAALTNFTGVIRIAEGVLMTERPGMTGPADRRAGEIVVSDGATLAIAPRKGTCADYGMSVFNRIRLSGRGAGGIGALYNAASGVNVRDTFCGQIVLDADASTGGTSGADFGDKGGNAMRYELNGHTLTFGRGGSYVMNGAQIGRGNITVEKGARLQIQSGLTLSGDAGCTLTVKSGGTFCTYNGGRWAAPWRLVLEENAVVGASGSNPADRDRTDRNNWSGPVDLCGDVGVRGGAQALNLLGSVKGVGTFRFEKGWVRVTSPDSELNLVLAPSAKVGGLLGGETGLSVGNIQGAEHLSFGDVTIKGRWTLLADELETKVLETDGRLVFARGASFTLEGIENVVEAPARIVIARANGGLTAPAFKGDGRWRLDVSRDGRELALVRTDGRGAQRSNPLFRIGWITDTHVGKTPESCRLVKLAMDLFRQQTVDAVINNGDIADHYYPEGYAHYREIMDRAFAGLPKNPLEIYDFAWHDAYEWNGPRVRETNETQRRACYADIARRLHITHKMADRFEINGYVFLLFPQWTNDAEYGGKKGFDAYELALSEAERDSRGKPVFVIDHVPPEGTVAGSVTWGSAARRELFAKHPGIINLTGHTHGSLRDENLIWQGAFTTVNAGCLQVWHGDSAGCNEPSKQSYGAVVIEGFADRIVFRRYDVRDGMEYRKWNPWVVPWPFDPKTAPYSYERRVRATPVPAFDPSAALTVRASAPFTDFTVVLPPVSVGADSAYRYRMTVSERVGSKWRPFKIVEKYTQFYLRPSERVREVLLPLSAGYFTGGGRYRFEAAPVNFFGRTGASISCETTAPLTKPARLLWQSLRPMDEMPFVYGDDGTDGGKPVDKKNGWYENNGSLARLVIPVQAWNVPKESALRFTIDLETVQDISPESRVYNVSLMRFKPSLETACGRIRTLHGESGRQRYVIEFTKRDDVPYHFIVREGGPGRVRFLTAKSEVVEP